MVLGQSPTRRRLALAGFFLAQGSFFRQNFPAEEHLFSRKISEKMIIFPFLLSSELYCNSGLFIYYEARVRFRRDIAK